MNALGVEVDQLKGEIKRIALVHLALVGDIRFQHERAAAGSFGARRATPGLSQGDRAPGRRARSSSLRSYGRWGR